MGLRSIFWKEDHPFYINDGLLYQQRLNSHGEFFMLGLELLAMLPISFLLGCLFSRCWFHPSCFSRDMEIIDDNLVNEDPMVTAVRKGLLTCLQCAEWSPERLDLLKRKKSGLERKSSRSQLSNNDTLPVKYLERTTDQSYEWNIPSLGGIKFTDHCPQAFRMIRQMVQLELSVLMEELARPLVIRSSQGKSDAGRWVNLVFLETFGHKFILKTLRGQELDHLKSFVLSYANYLFREPDSRLPLYLGLISIERVGSIPKTLNASNLPGTKYSLVLMTNVFYTPLDRQPQFKFDFKGSTIGRRTFEDQNDLMDSLVANPLEFFDQPSLKEMDLEALLEMDWMGPFMMGADKERLIAQLLRDFNLLKEYGFMDYRYPN